MDLHTIIDEIAFQADDFLSGTNDRHQARAGITELLVSDYPKLSPTERKQVTDGVMAILEEEDFFSAEPGSEDSDEEASSGDQED